MKFQLLRKTHILFMIMCPLLVVFITHSPCYAEQEDEDTYSISLVQTAEADTETHEIEGKRVITEPYTIKDGDHIWNILRKKGLLEKRNLMEILSTLKKLNSSLTNLDLVHPGEKILIPLVIAPIEEADRPFADKPVPAAVPLEAIKDLDHYTIKPGDSLIKIVKNRYDIPKKHLYNEYLNQLKKLNPSIKDLNTIYPGQKVKLPIYSPKVVRAPIEQAPPRPEPGTNAQKEAPKLTGRQLGEIFRLIGEEWVQKGKHFIPLKTGGQINLNADSYPVIDLRSGKKVIVDLRNDLPEKMAGLITSNWDNYSIVHLEGYENLRGAIGKILPQCDYKKIHAMDEPLVMEGDIPLRITADWIIRTDTEASVEGEKAIIVTLCDESGSETPGTIKAFLESSVGIKVVDYPPPSETGAISTEEPEILETGDDRYSLVETLLNLTGRTFSSKTEIPIYQSEKSDFNLVVKADFILDVEGRDYIIDLSGLGSDIIDLLKDHQFMVLSISSEESSTDIVTKVLEFLGVEFDSKPHPFLAAKRAESKNIKLMIPGIIFQDNKSQAIFATHLQLPKEITRFLSQKGYRILHLPLS